MVVSFKGVSAYCAAGLAFHIIASAFNFYYVKVFINYYHIQESWFQLAQILHLIWNAISNPLFAYIQDSMNLKITKSRREGLLYCGPFFALSFLIPWIPWGESSHAVGIHLIVALFLWDTMFTFVGLTLSALFTEISQNLEDRIKLTRYAQMATVFGGPSVLVLEFTPDSLHNYKNFQMTTLFIAMCSLLLFVYAGNNAHTIYDLKKENTGKITKQTNRESYWKQIVQILFDRNFIAFAVTNFCHGFHKTFLNSFIAIVCDYLISDKEIPLSVRKMFYGGVPFISTIMVILGSTLVTRYSYYRIIRTAFLYMISAGIIMLHLGPGHPWLLMLFLLADNCAAGATFSLFNMPLADIADDNKLRYNREYPISSTVFGLSALLSKPALSLSPMFTVAILNTYGYDGVKDKTFVVSSELKHIMFLLVCFYPIVSGSIQLIAWSYFHVECKTKQINIL